MRRIQPKYLPVILALSAGISGAWADDPKPQTIKGALDVTKSAAELRAAQEDYRLGVQAADGNGIPQSYLAAANYYQKAAEAQNNLGTLYSTGQGVLKPTRPFTFRFPDWNRQIVSNTDARFQGNVVSINITGSWSPNCHDKAPDSRAQEAVVCT
jgi:TPR repeat protein